TGSFNTPGSANITLALNAGTNSVQIGNPDTGRASCRERVESAAPVATSYETEAGTLAGGARVSTCAACSGGRKAGYVGNGGTVTFTNVNVPSAGSYQVTLVYCDGSTTGRQAVVSANGGTGQTITFTPTGSFNTPGSLVVTLTLNAGVNSVQIGNP